MAEEIGKIEKPEISQFQGKKILYLVPLLYSWQESPKEYIEKYDLYWQQIREYIVNLESRIGSIKLIYHESVTAPGDDGLKILEKLNPSSYQLVREKCLMGAQLELVEDKELVEETMDWERHLIVGFISDKVARMVSQFFTEASRKRYEHIAERVKQTLQEDGAGLLIIREGHQIQFPPDIEVFMVAPPALNEIHRWLRDRREQEEKEDIEAAASEENPESQAGSESSG